MANPVKGEASFKTAAGPTLTLRFDFEALVAAEDAVDTPLLDVLASLEEQTPRLSIIRALLFGSLQFHHPEMTMQDAGQLVMTDTELVSQTLMKAVRAGFPAVFGKEARGGGPRPPKPRRGTGTPSSKRGAKRA